MDTDVDRALDFYLTRNQAFSQPPSIEPHDHTTSARKVGSPRARGPGVWWWRRLRRRAARLTIPDDDGAQRRHVPPFARRKRRVGVIKPGRARDFSGDEGRAVCTRSTSPRFQVHHAGKRTSRSSASLVSGRFAPRPIACQTFAAAVGSLAHGPVAHASVLLLILS
jgi:hypothetical protein